MTSLQGRIAQKDIHRSKWDGRLALQNPVLVRAEEACGHLPFWQLLLGCNSLFSQILAYKNPQNLRLLPVCS